MAIVTNAEAEHLDHYGNEVSKLHHAYTQFLDTAKIRVINAEDEFLKNYKNESTKLYPNKDIKNCTMRIEKFQTFYKL